MVFSSFSDFTLSDVRSDECCFTTSRICQERKAKQDEISVPARLLWEASSGVVFQIVASQVCAGMCWSQNAMLARALECHVMPLLYVVT